MRQAIAIGIIILTIGIAQSFMVCSPVQAETWVMVAKSNDTQEQQYVDVDSIEVMDANSARSVVRLNTYWGFLDQPNSMSYATTEYRCLTEEYRDVVVNQKNTAANWKPIGADPLNRAAMRYACSKTK